MSDRDETYIEDLRKTIHEYEHLRLGYRAAVVALVLMLASTFGFLWYEGKRRVAAERGNDGVCREEVVVLDKKGPGKDVHTCPSPRHRIDYASIFQEKAGEATYVCRCIDLQAVAHTHTDQLSNLQSRVARIERNGVAPPAASARLDTLEWEVSQLEDKVAKQKPVTPP